MTAKQSKAKAAKAKEAKKNNTPQKPNKTGQQAASQGQTPPPQAKKGTSADARATGKKAAGQKQWERGWGYPEAPQSLWAEFWPCRTMSRSIPPGTPPIPYAKLRDEVAGAELAPEYQAERLTTINDFWHFYPFEYARAFMRTETGNEAWPTLLEIIEHHCMATDILCAAASARDLDPIAVAHADEIYSSLIEDALPLLRFDPDEETGVREGEWQMATPWPIATASNILDGQPPTTKTREKARIMRDGLNVLVRLRYKLTREAHPKDLIKLSDAVRDYPLSRTVLRRMVHLKKLKDHRSQEQKDRNNVPIRLSRAALEKIVNPKQK